MKVLTNFSCGMPSETGVELWVYRYAKVWKWEWAVIAGVQRVIGVWLDEADAVAFRLKFGL